ALGGITAQGITKTSAFPDFLNADRLTELLSRESLAACLKPSSWQPGLADLLWSLFPRLYANTVNLKQFRDVASPVAACYQAITNAKMKLECINRAGLLGQQNLLMGQIDGGYSIDVYRHGNLPIIDALGLEVSATHRDGDVDIATLQPVCPFWMQVDMAYAKGDVVSWRSSTTKWKWQVKSPNAEQGTSKTDYEVGASDLPDSIEQKFELDASYSRVEEEASLADADDDDIDYADDASLDDEIDEGDTEVQTLLDFKPKTTPTDNLYNTARGAGEELSGPFLSPNTTVRVLPLLADERKLNQFVASYLDVENFARYRAWGRHVYLLIYNYPSRSSETQNVGMIANREINFAVPVKCYDWFDERKDNYNLHTPSGRRKLDKERLTGTALVVPFSYVDDVTVAITSSEVEGVPTLHSAIDSPPVRWMDTDGPDNSIGSILLDSSALVLPSLGVGAGARHKSLLSVSTKPPIPDYDEAGWRQVAKRWGPKIAADLARKFRQRGPRNEVKSRKQFRWSRAFALELLAGKLSIVNLALKQFRDSWDTKTACYQSLVQGRRKIDMLHELHEIEESLHVSIARFPTQPIADVLGLIPKHTEVGRDGIVDIFEALRPFWLRADLSKDLGRNLFERVGDREWSRQQHAHQLFGWHPITVDRLERQYIGIDDEGKSKLIDSAARISFEQPSEGFQKRETAHSKQQEQVNKPANLDEGDILWERTEKPLELTDIAALRQLQHADEVRHLMVWSREREVSLMAHPLALDRIDRSHVPDLAAYLKGRDVFPERPKKYRISELAECVGSVDPATVLDSMLSRQWGRAEHERAEYGGKADFCVNCKTFGRSFADRLFPEREQQYGYWPQDSDYKKAYEFIRHGIALQLHRAVWGAINDAGPGRGFGKAYEEAFEKESGQKFKKDYQEQLKKAAERKADEADKEKLRKVYEEKLKKACEEKFKEEYKKEATKFLPDFFKEQPKNVTPENWDKEDWASLADQLQALIDEYYKGTSDEAVEPLTVLNMTSSATIKPLTTLMKQARKQAKMMETESIDPNEKPREISLKFLDRLRDLAQPERD
ncbi:MAG: hypothetical protein ACR2QJ_14770, partial [Geminicoccaceae bacterium]